MPLFHRSLLLLEGVFLLFLSQPNKSWSTEITVSFCILRFSFLFLCLSVNCASQCCATLWNPSPPAETGKKNKSLLASYPQNINSNCKKTGEWEYEPSWKGRSKKPPGETKDRTTKLPPAHTANAIGAQSFTEPFSIQRPSRKQSLTIPRYSKAQDEQSQLNFPFLLIIQSVTSLPEVF